MQSDPSGAFPKQDFVTHRVLGTELVVQGANLRPLDRTGSYSVLCPPMLIRLRPESFVE